MTQKDPQAEMDAALAQVNKDMAEAEENLKKLNTAFADAMLALSDMFTTLTPKKK